MDTALNRLPNRYISTLTHDTIRHSRRLLELNHHWVKAAWTMRLPVHVLLPRPVGQDESLITCQEDIMSGTCRMKYCTPKVYNNIGRDTTGAVIRNTAGGTNTI